MTDSIAFIHLSDIHFGQERDGFVYINDDVKQQLIEDIREVVATLPNRKAAGVLVTGDIAYSGKAEEYERAGAWLDEVTVAAGCERIAVMMVPGNHDIDLSTVDRATKLVLDDILENGQASLEAFLATEHGRDTLYRRFEAYQPFAEAYNCSLDREGGMPGAQSYYLTEDKSRTLRFVGLNSALTCDQNRQKGQLLLGRRQWPISGNAHEEVVVLVHHPLDWLQDSADSRGYILNRARVLITGHEHNPQLNILDVDGGGNLMMLAAGATIRPENEADVAYTYNVLEFSWLADEDALSVTIHPRTWMEARKQFGPDDASLGGRNRLVKLRRPTPPRALPVSEQSAPPGQENVAPPAASEQKALLPKEDINSAADIYPQLRLRFFRELTPKQRVNILVGLDALPADYNTPLTHADEKRALDGLRHRNLLEQLSYAIEEQRALC